MEFKSTTIAPKGRNKYGNYSSPGNITKKVTMTTYAGNNTTTTIGDNTNSDNGNDEEPELVGFYCVLTNTSKVFDMAILEQHDDTDFATVIAYRGTEKINAYICDMDSVQAIYDEDDNLIDLIVPANSGITGIPSGMSISISDNGTSAATIYFTMNRSISGNSGVVNIPVTVYNRRAEAQPSGEHISNWYQNNDYCEVIWLTYNWSINRTSVGRNGAAIRGPYAWEEYSGTTRWWCAGTPNSANPDTEKWIDVIVKDGVYYYCNTTYEGTLAPWASVDDKWTEGESFDFVATNLLMASGASINFLTGNELYLRDSNNVITAGAMGGDNINFWAGATSADTALWYVKNDGSMVAQKGTFGVLTIGTDSHGDSTLYANNELYNESWALQITPNASIYTGLWRDEEITANTQLDSVAIVPDLNVDLIDVQALIGGDRIGALTVNKAFEHKIVSGQDFDSLYSSRLAICSNGTISGFELEKKARHGKDIPGIGGSYAYRGSYGSVPVCDMVSTDKARTPGLEIQFRTTNSANFTSAGTWMINGVNTLISHKEPRSLFYQDTYNRWCFDGTILESLGIFIPTASTYTFAESTTKYWHFKDTCLGVDAGKYDVLTIMRSYDTFAPTCYVGYWFACNGNAYMDAVYLGIGSSTANGMVMRNNTIYIEV